ncbi:rRNA-processing protein UTP23 homolog [Diadema antillarum]|uniref:rRNA-processing protein UTP23 homolog n=1 Tax=Diadema antillarum TaxID=105358 RepID=UPI003A85EFD8
MKVKRYKHARKYLGFYRNNFNFREPHQILVDGTFTQMALLRKINIKEQMPKYLGGEVQLTTTNCILSEVEALGKAVYGGYLILKRYQVRRCGHKEKPVSAFRCIMSMIADQNKNHYFVATQDPDLSGAVNRMAGTPLLYIHFNAIVLEKPSESSVTQATALTTRKVNPTDSERKMLTELMGGEGDKDPEKKRKRKGPKGPNPLSVKKKKKKLKDVHSGGGGGGPVDGKDGESGGKKRTRRRKRIKIAPHVKEHMSHAQAVTS